jgi:hypothetical protein
MTFGIFKCQILAFFYVINNIIRYLFKTELLHLSPSSTLLLLPLSLS